MIPGEEGMTLKSDIDRFYTEEIQMKKLLIETIKPKLKQKFVDPFVYEEDPFREDSKTDTQLSHKLLETHPEEDKFKYLLEK